MLESMVSYSSGLLVKVAFKTSHCDPDIYLFMGWYDRAVPSRRLVPGDVVVLLRGKATCDMVILRGNCLVEESMLSGEASSFRLALLE